MASNILHVGHDLVVYDVRPDAIAALVEKGAVAASSPADLLDRCDVAITMVFGPKEIDASSVARAGSCRCPAVASNGST